MGRTKHAIIEYRKYDLATDFPILLLTGNIWRISDIRSDRLHFHNCLEIGLCEEGCGTLEFMNIPMQFQTGDVTFIASDIAHTTYSAAGTRSKWSYLFIDEEFLFSSFFPSDFVCNFDFVFNLLHHFFAVFTQSKFSAIHSLTTMIIDELEHKRTNYQFTVRSLFFALFLKIINLNKEIENTHFLGLEIAKKSLVIAPALDFIRQNSAQDFPIEKLAELCCMSITHFRRTFLDIIGTSPLDYLNRLRIKNASILLRTTDMPIVEISEEVGFRSLSSFNRHFSLIIGTTPTLWRREKSCIQNQDICKYPGWLIPPKEPKKKQ